MNAEGRASEWIWKGLRRVPQPSFVFAWSLSTLIALPLSSGGAQDPVRPWLDWRTIQTRNYRFHFPRELEAWTRAVAERVESTDSAIVALVGSTPPRPVDVVIDDPFGLSNGYVLPMIDRPVTVWWATPPDPRTEIGNYHTWGEMLSVHELAHVVHLTRPTRNPLRRQLWSSLPVNLGPITRNAPRWVFEGYATVIEGRITGSGRPNNAWRPAILRQWAIEGRLPTYGQLNGWDDFFGGDFPYLGGSAFLEWLARRNGSGDSSFVHVWRRLTARQVRSFDASFAGVYGDSPRTLYGRHVAELTRDAMAAKAELERAGLVEGELIQRLAWHTGDPALSPDGEHVAVVLRERERPGRVVVWRTSPEQEDTASIRKRVEQLTKDPLDVPDRRFYPVPKKAVKTLPASNGRSYQLPRWFSDNRRILVTRWTPRADGTTRPDLYVWDTETDQLRRVTRGSGVLHGDPHPTANDAIAMHCHRGHCDIARVDLARGAITTLLAGDPRRSYYRPRYSRDGSRFAASVSDSGRWRILVADRDGANVRYVDPDDGVNRYDAQWLSNGDTLVVVSERGGIANLERLDVVDRSTRSLTRVTGAALGPDVSRKDGAIWFLALSAHGLDVRRLPRHSPTADSVVSITADRFGFAGRRGTRPGIELAVAKLAESRPYGAGPRHQRWLPGGYASSDGAGAFITIYSGDIVGRLNATVTGAYGEAGTWRGGSLRATWRYPRPAIELGVHAFLHEPSLSPFAQPAADSLDAGFLQGAVATGIHRQGDGWQLRARVGGSAGHVQTRLGGLSHFRGLGFGEGELVLQQSRGARGLVERLRVHTSQGHTRDPYLRAIGSLEIETTGRDRIPLHLSGTVGRMSGEPHPFERFTVGGVPSPIADSSVLAQRYGMPWFPTGIAVGKSLLAWRIALPDVPWTLFYEGASTAADVHSFTKWNRALGIETRFVFGPMPVAFVPRVQLRSGAAYTLDEPFRKKVRAFLEMRMEP